MSFSPRSSFAKFSVLHSVKCYGSTWEDELTKLSLIYLLGRKSEGREQFHDYLHKNLLQCLCERDLSIDTEFAEGFLEGREQIYERIIASTDVFDCLRDPDVRELCKRNQRIREIYG